MGGHGTKESWSLLDYLSPPRASYVTPKELGITASLNSPATRLLPVLGHTPENPDAAAGVEADAGALLADILLHSEAGIAASLDRRCLLLQLSLAVLAIHGQGNCHGGVSPYTIRLALGGLLTLCPPLGPNSAPQTDNFHCHMPTNNPITSCQSLEGHITKSSAPIASVSAALFELTCQPCDDSKNGVNPTFRPERSVSACSSLSQLTEEWRLHRMTNLEYLLHLNRLAGRTGADLNCLPLMPWVIDFSCDPRPGLRHRCATSLPVTLHCSSTDEISCSLSL
jgi:hypothetical protein